jgi:glucan biosynthesis protein C
MAAMPVPLAQTGRRDDIDWLRVLGTIVVFLFHTTRFFNTESWHVKNATLSPGLDLPLGIVSQWLMPLFFLLSGASTYFALRPGGVGRFVGSRLLRLGIPIVLGMLIIAPPQVYIELVTSSGYAGSLPHFYLNDYFHGLYGRGGNFAVTGMHLWYLFWLLLYSLVLLPIFLALRSRPGRWLIRVGANVFAHPGSVLLLGLPIPILHILGEATDVLWTEASWNLLAYIPVLLLGFVIMADERYDVALRKAWPWALGGAVALTALTVAVWDYSEEPNPLLYVRQWALRGMAAWCWLVAMLGAARRALSFSTPFVRYANELALPFYILHQTVIVCVGFLIRDWDIPIIAKWPLLAAICFVVIMGLYEFAIRRVNVLRILFGMRVRPRRAAAIVEPAPVARA